MQPVTYCRITEPHVPESNTWKTLKPFFLGKCIRNKRMCGLNRSTVRKFQTLMIRISLKFQCVPWDYPPPPLPPPLPPSLIPFFFILSCETSVNCSKYRQTSLDQWSDENKSLTVVNKVLLCPGWVDVRCAHLSNWS